MSTQYLQQQNGRIAYEDAGAGPLVVCLPSIGDVRAEYRFLAAQLLKAGCRVVQMDLRGLGESSTGWQDYSVAAVGGDLLAVIRSLEAGPALVVGTSMAAGAGAWAAVEQPESIAGLVMIGPAVHGETTPANRLLYSLVFARPWGPSAWVKYYNTLYPARKPQDFATYLSALHSNLGQPGRIEAVRRMILASKSASEQRLARVNVPVLVILGSRDPDFKDPEAEARWVAQQVHGTFHVVQDAGHYPHTEMPEIAGPLIIDFIQSIIETLEKSHVT